MATAMKRTFSNTRYKCASCENVSNLAEGVTFHKFPHDPAISNVWINFVKKTNPEFIPRQNSRLCSSHFLSSCFPWTFQQEFGLPVMRRDLKKGSIPTIQTDENLIVIDQSSPKSKVMKLEEKDSVSMIL